MHNLPIYFKSSLDYLIQYKSHVQLAGARQIQVLLFGTFWNFFSLGIFDLWLVESEDAEPADTEGLL